MSVKTKGTNAERDLVHLFWKSGWAAIRVAGSGSSKYPSADVLASNNKGRVIAIEAKSTRSTRKYLPDIEIRLLKEFCVRFGAEPWIAVKFLRKSWFFLKADDLERTGSNHCVSIGFATEKGLSFDEVIKEE